MRQSLSEWISQRAGTQRSSDAETPPPPDSGNQIEHYIYRVQQLLEIAKQQATELSSERRKRQRTERELSDVRDQLKESERSRRENRRTLRRASRELNSLRRDSKPHTVIKLREKIETIHEQYSNELIKERNRRTRVETNLNSEETKIEPLQRSRTLQHDGQLSSGDRVIEERDRRRKAEKDSKRLKRNLRHVSRELNSLRSEHKKCRRGSPKGHSNGNKYTPELFSSHLAQLDSGPRQRFLPERVRQCKANAR